MIRPLVAVGAVFAVLGSAIQVATGYAISDPLVWWPWPIMVALWVWMWRVSRKDHGR